MSSPRHKRSVKAPMRFKDFVNFDKIRCEQLQQKSAGLVPGDREQLSPDVEPGEVAPSGQLAAAGVPGASRLLVNQQSADSDSDMSTREVEVNEDEDVELEECRERCVPDRPGQHCRGCSRCGGAGGPVGGAHCPLCCWRGSRWTCQFSPGCGLRTSS